MERLRALDDGAAREAYWQLQLPETCTRFAPHLPEVQRRPPCAVTTRASPRAGLFECSRPSNQPVTDFTHALTHALIHTRTTPHPHHSTAEPTPEPEPEPYQAQRARFAELGARFAERTRQLSEPSAVDESALLKAARQTAETAPLLEWLRLLGAGLGFFANFGVRRPRPPPRRPAACAP